MNDINQIIQELTMFYNSGKNPQQLMQTVTQNSGMGQINQMKAQIQNMAQGRSPQEFILQVAKQNGATDENLQNLARILGAK